MAWRDVRFPTLSRCMLFGTGVLLLCSCGPIPRLHTVRCFSGRFAAAKGAPTDALHRREDSRGTRSFRTQTRGVKMASTVTMQMQDISGMQHSCANFSQRLLSQLLQARLHANYSLATPAGKGCQAAVRIVLDGLDEERYVGEVCSTELDAVASAEEAVIQRIGQSQMDKNQEVPAHDYSSELDASKIWGVMAYTTSPLPIGMTLTYIIYTLATGDFQVVIQTDLPPVASPEIRGAHSRSIDDAESSTASMAFYSILDACGRRGLDTSLPAADPKKKLEQLILNYAQNVHHCSFNVKSFSVPVGGFQAAAELQLTGSEDVHFLRGALSSTKTLAQKHAVNAVYEALLKPLWKQTAALSAPRSLKAPMSDPRDLSHILSWRAARVQPNLEKHPSRIPTLDLWFGGACLCCLLAVQRESWNRHILGERHRASLNAVPVSLRPEILRPKTVPEVAPSLTADFDEVCGWMDLHASILTVGEMDFSFSLAVANMRSSGSNLVATSYLQKYGGTEPEVYPDDDAERASFQRRSLPSMGGALFQNLDGLTNMKAQVKHAVDATALLGTLRTQGIHGPFDHIIFPFPRVSLRRENDPQNSELLRGFFFSACKQGFLAENGVIQLVLLSPQYEELDVAGVAAEAGLSLWSQVKLPAGFYQPREVSGKAWRTNDATLFSFGQGVRPERNPELDDQRGRRRALRRSDSNYGKSSIRRSEYDTPPFRQSNYRKPNFRPSQSDRSSFKPPRSRPFSVGRSSPQRSRS